MKPPQELQFGPLNLYGNPIRRPPNTASLCQDIRVMPGGWLRLRSGRIAKCNFTNAYDVLRIEPVAFAGQLGNSTHFAQVVYGASDARAVLLTISAGAITAAESGIEQLCNQYSTFATQIVPFAQLPDAFVFGNGLGYHYDGTALAPTPFLSYYDSAGVLRYFGLSARANSFGRTGLTGSLGLSFTPGSGGQNYNQVTTSVKIYIGLYNSTTGHYSNGLLCGQQNATGGTGTLYVTNAGLVNWATHGTTETNELKYVFYATLDGGAVPYLIMLDDLSGPFTATLGTSSPVGLNLSSGTDNGWKLDLTKEMPTKNYAPRQMSCIWFANSRMYGIPYEFYDQAGFTTPPDEMEITIKDQGSVCWSEAEGSSRRANFLGDPLQSWPFNNISPCPSGERPIWGCSAPNGVDSMVWTATRLFLLKEQADGLHEWECIADTHGLFPTTGPRTVKRTNYGICWMSQRKQIMLYEGGGKEGVRILSKEYDSVLKGKGKDPVCAAYFFDPINFVDRYEVFWNTGSLCHDFHIGAWTSTQPHSVRASAMLVNPTGDTYLLIGAGTINVKMGLYSVEGQPDQSMGVPLIDQIFTNASGSATTNQELPEGYWANNWHDFGDSVERKEVLELHLIGDGASSAQLTNSPPMRVELFADFQSVAADSGLMLSSMGKEKQSATDQLYVYRLSGAAHKRWYKFLLRMRSHSTEAGSTYFADPSFQGDYSSNFYGSIMAWFSTLGKPLNYR